MSEQAVLHEMRVAARAIFDAAWTACTMEQAFEQVYYERGVLQVGEDLYDLGAYTRLRVMAFGKAAQSAVTALRQRLGGGVPLDGIVSSPNLPSTQMPGWRYFQGGHPLPNEESQRAAHAMLHSLHELDEQSLAIYLISGGGSACTETTLDETVSLDELRETYRVLVHSGAPIASINALRKHLSAIKGGRLAVAAGATRQLSLLVSDVPEGALDALASGPTLPDHSTCADCYDLVRRYDLLAQFPTKIRNMFEQQTLAETPKADEAAFVRSRWYPLLSNATALVAAQKQAERMGFAVTVDNGCDDWEYRQAADYLLEKLRALQKQNQRICLLSGGEVTVRLGAAAGRGGRNQQFALDAATKIADQNIAVLSAGTDGRDGNSLAAGALVDGTTLARGAAQGLDAAVALQKFDAGTYLEAVGDAITTGPTETNVRDVRALFAW